MAVDKKISQLDSGAPAQAGDEYVVARSGANYKLTLTNIAASMPPIGATTPNTGSFTSLTNSGNLTFSSTGQRITFDMSGAISNRLMFQTSTTNSASRVGVIPNGTSAISEFGCYNSSSPDNASLLAIKARGSDVQIDSTASGTGTAQPLTFAISGGERMRLDTSGNLLLGTATGLAGSRFTVVGGGTQLSGGTTAQEGVRIQRATGYATFTGINNDNNAYNGLQFFTGASAAATIDTSGNVGIGTASPNYKISVNGTGNFYNGVAGLGRIFFGDPADPNGYIGIYRSVLGPSNSATAGNGLNFASIDGYTFNTGATVFGSQTERMRIDSSGNVGIGTASPGAKLTVSGGSSTFAHINGGNSNTDPIFASVNNATVASADFGWLWYNNATNGNLDLYRRAGSTTNTQVLTFARASGNLGVGQGTPTARLDVLADSGDIVRFINSSVVGVSLAAGSTSFTTLSDERSKTDLVPINDAVSKLKELRTVVGRYNQDAVGVERSFLIAQDVQKVFSPAVDTNKPDELGLRYTDMIPLLVAAINELSAKVAALEAK